MTTWHAIFFHLFLAFQFQFFSTVAGQFSTSIQICYALQNLFFCFQGNLYNIDALPVNMFVVSIASFPLPVGLLLNLVPSPISSLNRGGGLKTCIDVRVHKLNILLLMRSHILKKILNYT